MIILACSVTCPSCGHVADSVMPEGKRVRSFVCPSCSTRLVPEPGDCCIYCSHGSVPCPAAQKEFLAMFDSGQAGGRRAHG